MSRSLAPIRWASAQPSAVATFGLVVTAYNWPTPPVARITADPGSDAPVPPLGRIATPRTVPSSSQHAGDLGVLEQLNLGMAADHLSQASDERGSGPVAARMDDAGSGVGGFEPESQLAVGAAIEDGAQRQELVNPVRAFTCEDADRLGVGQPVAGRHGVGRMLAGAVSGPERHGDPALGPRAGAIGQRFLSNEDHREAFGRQSPRRPEAGDSGADDDGRR